MDESSRTEHYTPSRAAERLGVSPRTVQLWLRSGEIAGEQDRKTGRWSISAEEVERVRRERGKTGGKNRDRGELVEVLRERIEDLRGQLEAEREARRRADAIIAGLVERVPELEAPRESPQEPQERRGSAAEGSAAGEHPGGPEKPSSRERVPWWRRIFR